jgi:aminoglycoside 3-N-acetyltransferase
MRPFSITTSYDPRSSAGDPLAGGCAQPATTSEATSAKNRGGAGKVEGIEIDGRRCGDNARLNARRAIAARANSATRSGLLRPVTRNTLKVPVPIAPTYPRDTMHSRQQLAADLRALGLARGDVVMVHASLRAIGEIAGGPDEVHLAIKDVVTEDGSLIMYASCPAYVDEIGRGNLTREQEAELLEKLPPFDPYTARAQRDNGALVELLRTYPGSRVNPHVVRFVVWGKHVDYLMSQQPWNYAFGHGSLLERFVNLNGKILLLGSDHDTVTFLHYAEHIGDFPGKRVSRFKVPVLENGERVWRDMEEFDTSSGAHPNWSERFFADVVDTYLVATDNDGGRIGNASSHLFRAVGLLEFALPMMAEVAADASILETIKRGVAEYLTRRDAHDSSGAAMSERGPLARDDVVLDLGDLSDPNRRTTARPLSEYSEDQQRHIRAIRESPDTNAREALVREIAARGPFAVALVNEPIAEGVLTEVYLNAPQPLTRFFVVAESALDDEVIDRATSLALKYEMQFPADSGAVRFTLFEDGSYVRESATHGRVEDRQFFEGFYAKRDRRSQYVRRFAEHREPIQIPRVGPARVVSLGEL